MAKILLMLQVLAVLQLAVQHAAATATANLTQYPGVACLRECVAGDHRICHYHWTMEHYQAMGVACGDCRKGNETDCNHPQCIVGDGVEKGVMSINRLIPGPDIQVCKGDYIVVDLLNAAAGTAAAIHWHGLHMVETPFMDGVPFLTQCPISYATSFRYAFYASEAGTQFYHSHAGHHKINGQYGALIVRQPVSEEVNSDSYDHDLPEHHMVISDWMHSYGETLFPGLPNSGGIFPDSVLINGRGQFINPKTGIRLSVPPARFYVTAGQRYRFRLINSVSHACPFQIQIENHRLNVIATDSFHVEPQAYDTLVTNSGERYDFVLDANQPAGDYWIRVRALGVCTAVPAESFALLRVGNEAAQKDEVTPIEREMPAYEDTFEGGLYLNHPNATCFANDPYNKGHCITELHSQEEPDIELLYAAPAQRLFLAFHNYPVSNAEIFQAGKYHHFANLAGNVTIVGAINNISLIMPAYPPLTQPEDIDSSQFCNANNMPEYCDNVRLCPCIHHLKMDLNSIVELVVVDESESVGRMHHPYHLHGHKFVVTAMARRGDEPMTIKRAKLLSSRNLLARNLQNDNPTYKDTVSIPSRGFAVIRFRATNPGFWLMHCHYEWHLSIGMGLILQVGELEDMKTAPANFPRCNNYMPDIQLP